MCPASLWASPVQAGGAGASRPGYSITSSARASSSSGSHPELLGHHLIDVQLDFVTRCTGRSIGFSPLRMRPV